MEENITYNFGGEGLTNAEKRWAKQRFEDYSNAYPHLSKISDLQLLEELVFREALQERSKKIIKTLGKNKTKDDKAQIIPRNVTDQLNANLEYIMQLKTRLGMFEEKTKLDAFKDIQSLFQKFKNWRKLNQGSRKVTCPFCSKIFFLKIRTDKYNVEKFPFFQDKVLCNEELHKAWKEGCITKERYAKILNTSPDFIDWLDENWFQKKSKEESETK